MEKSKVAIVRCESYDEELVYQKIKQGIQLLGWSIANKKEKTLLKVNNLAGANPEEAVTTHPSVFNAMIKVLLEQEAIVTYGDSPGFEKPLDGLTKSGFVDAAKRYDIQMADFDQGTVKEYGSNRFLIANGCIDVGIISLPKAKTHGLTRITGAVKNQFGCIVGLHKAAYHVKRPDPSQFSKMLVDLNMLLKPKLYVMDCIVAMEGNGPRSGNPVQMNCLILSTDPVAVDATFCRLIGLDPLSVWTNRYAKISGLGNIDDIEYVGEPLEKFIKDDFKVDRKPLKKIAAKNLLPKAIRNRMYAKPVIDAAKCTKCGVCVDVCPVKGKAITFVDDKNPPLYNYDKCIRCYCCQEMCPNKAINIK